MTTLKLSYSFKIIVTRIISNTVIHKWLVFILLSVYKKIEWKNELGITILSIIGRFIMSLCHFTNVNRRNLLTKMIALNHGICLSSCDVRQLEFSLGYFKIISLKRDLVLLVSLLVIQLSIHFDILQLLLMREYFFVCKLAKE